MRSNQISKTVRDSIKKKLKGSNKIADSYTIIENRKKPVTFLKFSRKNGELYVSIFKRKSVYRNRKHKQTSTYLGKFKAQDVIGSGSRRTSRRKSRRKSRRRSRRSRKVRRSRRRFGLSAAIIDNLFS